MLLAADTNTNVAGSNALLPVTEIKRVPVASFSVVTGLQHNIRHQKGHRQYMYKLLPTPHKNTIDLSDIASIMP
jgi:hypothetical protein